MVSKSPPDPGIAEATPADRRASTGARSLGKAVGLTVLATVLLSAWFVFAGQVGWLATGVVWVALAGSAAPAIAVVIVRQFGRECWADAGFHIASPIWYLGAWAVGVAIPLVAAVATSLIGAGEAALTWRALAANIRAQGFTSIPAEPGAVLGFLVVTVVIFGAILTVFTFGEEIAWRGYVLPHLLVIGRTQALVGSGLAWAIFHIPRVLIGQLYPGQRGNGLVLIFPFFVGLGIIVGHFRLKSKSVFVTSVLHGTFSVMPVVANVLVVPNSATYGGFQGIVGILAIWSIAAWLLWQSRGAARAPREIDGPA